MPFYLVVLWIKPGALWMPDKHPENWATSLFLKMCVCVCHGLCAAVREQFSVVSALSHTDTGSGDWTQITWFVWQVWQVPFYLWAISPLPTTCCFFKVCVFTYTWKNKNYLIQWLVEVYVFSNELWFSCHGSYIIDLFSRIPKNITIS